LGSPSSDQYRIANLTPGLSAEDGDGRRTLYSAFVVATVLVARIWEDMIEFISNLPRTISGDARRIPCLSALPTYNVGLPSTLSFDIFRPLLHGLTSNSLLYIAVVRDGDGEKEIIVKFTCRNCIELHTFGILGYQKLRGNRITIAMDYMSVKQTTHSPGRDKRRELWTAAARKLVKSSRVVAGFMETCWT